MTSVAFSPDGKFILTGDWNKLAQLWDRNSGKLLRTFSGHQDALFSVAFSPDGQSILTGSWDTSARLWNVTSGKQEIVFPGSESAVADVAFSPDGSSALTGSRDGTVRIWRIPKSGIARGDPAARFLPGGYGNARFSPDAEGRFMLLVKEFYGQNDNGLEIMDTNTGELLQSDRLSNALDGQYSPDGKLILIREWDGSAQLRMANKGLLQQDQISIFPQNNDVVSAAFSPDSRYILTAGWDRGGYLLWDASTQQKVTYMMMGNFSPNWISVAFSPDGKTILTSDVTIKLRSFPDGTVLRSFPYPEIKDNTISPGVTAITYSPDGRYVLAGSTDTTAHLWETATGSLVRIFSGHKDGVYSVAFSPDGRYVLTASNDKTARLWETATGDLVRILGGNKNYLNTASFSPDGKWILTAGGEGARLWDTDIHDTKRTACAQLQRDLTPEERQTYGITDTTPVCAGLGKDQ